MSGDNISKAGVVKLLASLHLDGSVNLGRRYCCGVRDNEPHAGWCPLKTWCDNNGVDVASVDGAGMDWEAADEAP